MKRQQQQKWHERLFFHNCTLNSARMVNNWNDWHVSCRRFVSFSNECECDFFFSYKPSVNDAKCAVNRKEICIQWAFGRSFIQIFKRSLLHCVTDTILGHNLCGVESVRMNAKCIIIIRKKLRKKCERTKIGKHHLNWKTRIIFECLIVIGICFPFAWAHICSNIRSELVCFALWTN